MNKKTAILISINILSGIIMGFAFPKWDYSILAWIAIVPLLYSMLENPKHSFAYGFIWGIACNYFIFYWIINVIVNYSNVPLIIALMINLLLATYLSLYTALWAYLGSIFIHKNNIKTIWLTPFIWILLEYIRSYLLTGFPWCLVGYSQYKFISIIQIASIAGIYGISFLVILANCTLSILIFKKFHHKHWLRYVTIAVIIIIGCAIWGKIRVSNTENFKFKETIGIVQGNIQQDLKWLIILADEHFEKHITLTQAAISAKANLILWPESAITIFLMDDKEKFDKLMKLSRERGTYLLIGGDYSKVVNNRVQYYNSAFFINPDKNSLQIYSKMHLVPFGEYIPLKKLLWFLDKFVEGISDFSAGTEYTLFDFKGRKLSTQICYEIIFPDISRKFVSKGSELLTTITNDAWFGKTSAPYQHFAMATIRAVENKRYLLRAANTGISGIIDPYGRIIHKSELFKDYIIVDNIYFINQNTFYTKYGDWLCLLSFIIILIYSIPILFKKFRETESKT